MAAIERSEPKFREGLPVPDFRELWKHREWIRALVERFKSKSQKQDPQEGSDNDDR